MSDRMWDPAMRTSFKQPGPDRHGSALAAQAVVDDRSLTVEHEHGTVVVSGGHVGEDLPGRVVEARPT